MKCVYQMNTITALNTRPNPLMFSNNARSLGFLISYGLTVVCRFTLEFIDMCGAMCKYLHMATNLSIDPDLLDKALQVSGEKTKKAAVTQALVEFIAKREQTRVKDLFGQLDWDSDYDYKKERSR